MLVQELKQNTEILEIIKGYTYITKNGKVKHLLKTNLQFVEPTEYLITCPTTLTILEYKVNEISNKPFYIKEHNDKIQELESIIIKKDNTIKKKQTKIDNLNNDISKLNSTIITLNEIIDTWIKAWKKLLDFILKKLLYFKEKDSIYKMF